MKMEISNYIWYSLSIGPMENRGFIAYRVSIVMCNVGTLFNKGLVKFIF